jgi:hypothetical protein
MSTLSKARTSRTPETEAKTLCLVRVIHVDPVDLTILLEPVWVVGRTRYIQPRHIVSAGQEISLTMPTEDGHD